MDNAAFEIAEDAAQSAIPRGRASTFTGTEKKQQWSLMSIFLMCFLACIITTAVGVLILSLVFVNNSQRHSDAHFEPEARPMRTTVVPIAQKTVDPKFQFLNHLPKSQVFEFPGGAIQWARYRSNVKDYLTDEEEAFGTSLNSQRSQMTLGTLRIKSNGLRAPHWHFNANEHGYLAQGTAWIGVVDAGGEVVTTYNVTAGQVIFFPRNTLHWIKNVGNEDCFFLLFFSTHDELQTLDVDDVFFSTPEDIASRSLKPEGGINYIRAFHKQEEDQGVNLPPNLAELVLNASYVQSPDSLVWRYFFDLKGSKEYQYPGGVIQWAQYWKDGSELSNNEKIFSEFLNQHQNALSLSTLRVYNNGLRQPHFHFNANEMGYVLSGCGKVGIINTQGAMEFSIHIGDVVFFPVGTQHYIKSTCDEDLLFILAFSTGDQLQTLDMDDYLQATADHILAQLFFRKQSEFKKIPKFKEDQAINLP
ncbi:legumin J-like isoform X1 [Oryctolagus cuniculus]|uniref:legumin J-like n=1 Tax=Oryctolagus cuniculus TaxID=9986 RepID=UPI00048CF8FE|nr:legumin J-like [Oryctolagus cuniculus]XP_051707053.1 legumin J-like isoform X1 [Oryctolagus cuniculus]XP_051707054.1 legumin J-like isoform X1 [Oryctolagus cuniculus]XP_051707055.1 legumin J-like isoform X1 [Oryctolagus cuniculus]